MLKNMILAALFAVVAWPTNALAAEPFASIPPVQTDGWSAKPEDHGMSPEEFIRAESLHFMANMAQREGINNFYHFQSLAQAEDRWVVSPNNDVIYSMAIVDASNGFTLTLPETGDRFITAQIVSEEHMSRQLVGGGVYKFEAGTFPGSHVAIGIRIGTDATDKDVQFILNDLHTKMNLDAKKSAPVPTYDKETMLRVREAMMVEYDRMSDTFGLMTDDVAKVENWERFTYATAGAWGLAADQYAMYAPYVLAGAKAATCYVATYVQPIVNQFWSITAYNDEKYLMANENNIVNTGNVTLNDDNTFTVHFGSREACSGVEGVKNFILTTEDNWSFLMRAYEPDVAAFSDYEMPQIIPVGE